MKIRTRLLILTAVTVYLISCNSVYTPRPTGYFKIVFPPKAYRSFDKPGFPYSFEYPVYANIVQDTGFFDDQPRNPYWVNIDFPDFHGRIYISYNPIGGTSTFKVKDKHGNYVDSTGVNTLTGLVKGAYELTYKHVYKASFIDDSVFRTPLGVEGIYFKVGGNTATANQFLVTDSTRHFLRGALYFDATPNEDSLRVVNDFLREDMKHLINTLRWR